MRCNILFSILCIIPLLSNAQVIGDCNGAIVLCGGLFSEDQAPLTPGNTIEWTGACNNGVEQNSVWYTFTIQSDGELVFELTPNNSNDDYDWGLFNITEGGCAGISLQDGSSPEVSCNSWGTFGVNGPTGISTAQGGISNSGGPGDLNGPPFNADLPVSEGETYALVVMNWSNSMFGYELDFGESTASLYDDASPILLSATTDCANQTFVLTFSEPIVILSVDLLDFSLTGPGGTYNAVDVDSQTLNASYDSVLVVTLEDQIMVPGTYTINILDEGGYVEDPCGNLAVNTLEIEINDPILVDIATTEACSGIGGGIEITSIEGGEPPFVIYLDNELQESQSFNDLPSGFYDLLILDNLECEVAMTVEVVDHVITINIPPQEVIECSNGIALSGITIQPEEDVDIAWTFEPGNGNIVSGADSFTPVIDQPGLYTITITDPEDGCSFSAEVEIEQGLIDLIAPAIFSAEAECGGNTIVITFTEPVETNTVASGDFELVGESGNLVIEGVTPVQNGNDFDSDFILTLNEGISETGNYTIELTDSEDFILDQCGNIAVGNFEIQLYAPIQFDANATTACNGINGSIEVSNIQGGEGPFFFLLDGQSQSELLAEGLDDGEYLVVIEDENGCSTELPVKVPLHLIAVTIPLQDSLSCENPSVTIEGLSVVPDQEVTFQWIVDSNTGLISNGAATFSPTIIEPGLFTVVVTSEDGICEASTVVEVPSGSVYNVNLDYLIFPNVVTPNGDDKNESWAPYLPTNPDLDLSAVFDEYELKIFNRWGNLIFETSGGSVEWQVRDVSEGSYFYTLKYATNCGESISESREGIITIIK
jgi:gliding motility-associated-like protein